METLDCIIGWLTSTPFLDPKLVLWFGNRKENRDYDLFVITDSYWRKAESFQIGKADIIVAHSSVVERLLRYRDVLVVDALITGEILVGDEEYRGRLLEIVFKVEDIARIRRALLLSAMDFYKEAMAYLYSRSGLTESEKMDALTNMAFSASYFAASHFYSTNPSSPPVTLEQLLQKDTAISTIARETREMVRAANRGSTLKIDDLRKVVSRLEEWILNLPCA